MGLLQQAHGAMIEGHQQLKVASTFLLAIILHFGLSFVPFPAQASDDTRSQNAATDQLDPTLNEEVIRVEVDHDPKITLQVTLMKPAGDGPFPLAVLNHGLDPGDPHEMPRYRSAYIARYFVARGYLVALPMLRGFAGSDGNYISIGCDAEGEGLRQAKDIRTVIDYLKKQRNVDPERIVISGQSYGGWNALAIGALNIPGVKGISNFAGGRSAPFCASMQTDLGLGAGHFGALTTVPSIWFYGDNDGRIPMSLWQDMVQKYRTYNDDLELVNYGPFMKDSHNFLGYVEALAVWSPKMDAFLKRIGLPSDIQNAELLPMPYPPASRFASIDDVGAVPYLNDQDRGQYRDFLTKELPRAFVIAADGLSVTSQGGFDPLKRALTLCKRASHTCKPYAIDNDVVWQ